MNAPIRTRMSMGKLHRASPSFCPFPRYLCRAIRLTHGRMKKKITITESELRNLVEAALNELDYKTYLNAMRKSRARSLKAGYTGWDDDDDEAVYWNDRRYKFGRAAEKAFAKQFPVKGADVDPWFVSDVDNSGMIRYRDSDVARTHPKYTTGAEFLGSDEPDTVSIGANTPVGYVRKKIHLSNDDEMHGSAIPKDAKRSWRDYNDYLQDRMEYKDGKWGRKQREAFVHAVTEAVIRRLKRK